MKRRCFLSATAAAGALPSNLDARYEPRKPVAVPDPADSNSLLTADDFWIGPLDLDKPLNPQLAEMVDWHEVYAIHYRISATRRKNNWYAVVGHSEKLLDPPPRSVITINFNQWRDTNIICETWDALTDFLLEKGIKWNTRAVWK